MIIVLNTAGTKNIALKISFMRDFSYNNNAKILSRVKEDKDERFFKQMFL